MEKIALKVVGLANSQTQSGAFALVLQEENGSRRLPIIIGAYEAQAIAMELDKLEPLRPLTHDLFKNFAKAVGVNVTEILIYELADGVFYSKLCCFNGKQYIEVDARTSDAIALALRFNSAIMVYDYIIDQVGINVDDDDLLFLNAIVNTASDEPAAEKNEAGDDAVNEQKALQKQMEEMEKAMELAIKAENFERAARLRDDIAVLKNKLGLPE